MHNGGSGLRINDNTDLKLQSVGQCVMLIFGWALLGIVLAQAGCKLRALNLIVSLQVSLQVKGLQ